MAAPSEDEKLKQGGGVNEDTVSRPGHCVLRSAELTRESARRHMSTFQCVSRLSEHSLVQPSVLSFLVITCA